MLTRVRLVLAGLLILASASARAQDVHQAMQEIVRYQQEMEAAFDRHDEVYVNEGLIRTLLLQKGVTEAQFAKNPDLAVRMGGAWYSVDVGEAGGPGDYGSASARKFLNPEQPRPLYGSGGTLRKSYDFLMMHRDYYLAHPPREEMAYLRGGMNRWRQHVLAYYDELRSYLDLWAEFRAGTAKTPFEYWEKRGKLDQQYEERYTNSKVDAEFRKEMAALEEWRTGEDAKYEHLKLQMKAALPKLMERRKAPMIEDLETRFGSRVKFWDLNSEYVDLKARLARGHLSAGETAEIERRMRELEEQLGPMAEALERELGAGWKDRFRDGRTHRLPGGMLEDDSATKLKIFANEEYGTSYQIGAGDPSVPAQPIDLFKADPWLAGDYPGAPPHESVLDDVEWQPAVPTPATPTTTSQGNADVLVGPPNEWERDVSAAMAAVLSSTASPEEIAAEIEKNREFQAESRGAGEALQAERDGELALQNARVAAAEEARRERLEAMGDASLSRRRAEALAELQRYEQTLDENLKESGRSDLSPEERDGYERRLSRYSELMQPTPEEEKKLAATQQVRDEVNSSLNELASKMGGTSEAEVAARADGARMADAATADWRNFTFTGRMANEMGADIYHQRELGIQANNMVIAAQSYLRRTDLSPEQRAAGEQYLARAIRARGNAAEAILYDGAVVMSGLAADISTAAAGGTISRGTGRIFGSGAGEAGAQAGSQTAAQASAQGAAAAEDLVATQILTPAQQAAAAEAGAATTRMVNPQAAAAAEAGAATTRMVNPQAAAAAEAGAATTRMVNPQAAAAAEAGAATTRMVNPQAAAAAEAGAATTRMVNPQAAAAAEAGAATTRMVNPQAAAAAEAGAATTRMVNPQAAAAAEAGAATTRINNPQAAAAAQAATPAQQAGGVAEDLVKTQAASQGGRGTSTATTAASAADEAALRAENLAREAAIRQAARDAALAAEQRGRELVQSGQEISKDAAGQLVSKVQGNNLQPALDRAIAGAREAGVPESTIRACVGELSSHQTAPLAQKHEAILGLLEATAQKTGTYMPSSLAQQTLQTIARIQAGSAGRAEADFLRAQMQESAARGVDYFAELAAKGTVTNAGFQHVAGPSALQALRDFAKASGL